MNFKAGQKLWCIEGTTGHHGMIGFTKGKTYLSTFDSEDMIWFEKDDRGKENCWYAEYFVDKEAQKKIKSKKKFDKKFNDFLEDE